MTQVHLVQNPKFVKISSDFICIYEEIAEPIVTAVCLYIYTSLAYESVLEKCCWCPGNSWRSPENFCNQVSGNPSNM